MIDRRRWPEVDAILERVLELPADRRAAAIDTACAGDAELRAAVLTLLASDGEPESRTYGALLTGAGIEHLLAEMSAEPGELPTLEGETLGPYTVGPELGRGGMAIIHAAERTDGIFDQQVAIKLLFSGQRSGEIVERFRRERRILASLDHPNITRLLDGGASPDGRPYFVMERVDGEPIDLYCRRRGLALRPRLDLWSSVAEAVAHAHRRLLVHRDLKPSNILVTPAGQVKLLDFGIAKILGDEGSMSPDLTRGGWRPMTPRYSSPEQVAEQEITTATDVYQLGVLLYELLSGRSPYEVAGESSAEWVDAIRHQEPRRPSRALRDSERADDTAAARNEKSSGVTPQEIRGDLDAIVLKALRKRPEERYESVQAMRQDVDRHLSGLPVLARPATSLYRTRRFLRRHRGAVGAGLLLMLTLTGLGAFHTNRLASERELALREARKAAEVTAFLTEVFRGGNPEITGRDDLSARDLLERGAGRIDEELADQPEVRSEVQAVIGRAFLALGRYQEAEALQEAALATLREISGERSEDAAEILNRLGLLHRELGRYERADALLREALTIRRELPDADELDIASSLNNLGLVSKSRGQLEEARGYYEEALEIKERILGPEHPSLGSSLSNLAAVCFAMKELERSKALSRRAVALFEAHDEPALASSLTNLANTLRRTGEFEEAKQHLERAVKIKERAYGPGHPRVAGTLDILGGVLRGLGDRDGARHAYERSAAIYRQGYGSDHPRVATPVTNLGLWHLEGGDVASAIELFREALRIRLASLGPEHPRVAQTRVRLAGAALAAGDTAIAEDQLHLAVEGLRAQAGSSDFLSEALLLLGDILTDSGRASAAEPLLVESVELRTRALGREDPETARALLTLGRCLGRLGRVEDARELFAEIGERFEGSNAELTAQARSAAKTLG